MKVPAIGLLVVCLTASAAVAKQNADETPVVAKHNAGHSSRTHAFPHSSKAGGGYAGLMEDHTIVKIVGHGKFVALDDGSEWEVSDGEEDQVESWGYVDVLLRDPMTFGAFTFYTLYNSEDREEVSVTFKGYGH
jgi:hypothetical protein